MTIEGPEMTENQVDLNIEIPHSARVYDYILGGKDNYPADREAAANIVADWPHLPKSMRANRHFMARTIRPLTAEFGIRQFLDIGTGLPVPTTLWYRRRGAGRRRRSTS